MIDKNSPVPLYHQIKEDIIAKIEANIFVEGQKIPSEHEIERMYGVSQITIRKALSVLVTEGYLTRNRGKGTFVCGKRSRHRASLISFSEELQQLGYESDIQLIDIRYEINSRIGKKMRLDENEELVCIKRVRLGNGEPVGIQTSYIPKKLVKLEEFDNFREVKSLYEVLRKLGIRPERVREKYIAVQINNPKTQKMLNVPPGSPAFFVEHYGYDQNGKLFEYTESILRGDKYELETETHDHSLH